MGGEAIGDGWPRNRTMPVVRRRWSQKRPEPAGPESGTDGADHGGGAVAPGLAPASTPGHTDSPDCEPMHEIATRGGEKVPERCLAGRPTVGGRNLAGCFVLEGGGPGVRPTNLSR